MNSQQLKDLSEKFKIHEIGNVGTDEFKKIIVFTKCHLNLL